jgi:class 3 adenylate cyclase/tetratricopeptide (TPR) repeat protein
VPACWKCGFESEAAFKFCPECGAKPSASASSREQRKTVTVLFCDVASSTELGDTLDPERLRALLAHYFERMKAIVDRHGGSVEKFIGDAVMAVFGVPVLHEDDALRAVRAAAEMREALPELGLEGRIGVMTGEVVTGTEERLATGDAVNVAARLQQAAQPGDVLIGQPTLALVRNTADVEPTGPLELKGKSERVSAFRLVRVRDAPERPYEGPFVGRERELATLRETWERVQAEQRCELVTVAGDAGVGKSRLAAEFLASIDATAVRGRCLPYGEGITYGPVVEAFKQLDVTPQEERAAVAIRSLLGETEAATSAEEIAWAFRKALEQVALKRPLVVVFDDIQWGEETFLDLIEHVALLSSDAPILLFCIARLEIIQRRPAWPVALRLEPLSDEDVDELIAERIAPELRRKIARAAGGNPLFVEEMLAMAGGAEGEVIVPPTLHALLAARLDQLETGERGVLERSSVEGEIFHRGAVQSLAPDEPHVTPHLAALVRMGLIRPNQPQIAGEDGFRFRHLLIRDAAYDALPKGVRAELHERYAIWLEGHGAELVELDEILGYHREQACNYRAELGMSRNEELASAARRSLTAAGHRAELRADYGAAAILLERAVGLEPPAELNLALEMDLVENLFRGGKRGEARRRADLVAERASAARDQVGELCARIQAGIIRLYLEPEGAADRLAALVEQAQPIFKAAGDDLAHCTAYHALAEVAYELGQTDAALEAYERAAVHAREAALTQDFLGGRAACRFYGTTPVSEILTWLDAHPPRAGRDYWHRIYRAMAWAMLGRANQGRSMLTEARAELAERGGGIQLAVMTGIESVEFELLAGDPAAAADLGAEGCRVLEEQGDKSLLSTAAGNLARALYALGRLEEADAWAGRAAEVGGSQDAFTQILWRQVRAKVLARGGENVEAERLAGEAVEIAEGTDFLNGQGEAKADLAEVLVLVGKPHEATDALAEAIERYERKGNLVSAQRGRTRLVELQDEIEPPATTPTVSPTS